MILKNKIKLLRELTGAGILDCKNAIMISNSNFNKAINILREKELVKAYKTSKNLTKENIISIYLHHNYNYGVMLELACQTDFVAKNKKFQELGNNLALQIALLKDIKYLSFLDIPKDILVLEYKDLRKNSLNYLIINNISNLTLKLKNISKLLNNFIFLKQQSFNNDEFNVENSIFNHISKFGENIKLKKFIRYPMK